MYTCADLPEGILEECEKKGKLVRIGYDSMSYDEANYKIHQEAMVYLPYGYDDKGEREYNTFYLMHGGNGNCEDFLGNEKKSSSFKNMLDNMIDKGTIAPLIVVAPTFYHKGTENALTDLPDARTLTQNYHNELVKDLIPCIEEKFHAMKGREHRAFSGFSMGSEATWNILNNAVREVKYFLPMSGDCWGLEIQGGLKQPEATVQYIMNHIKDAGMTYNDFRVFAATGDEDIAYPPMNTMLHKMMEHTEMFKFGDDFDNCNMMYCLKPGGVHTYDYCIIYMYNGLPFMFA